MKLTDLIKILFPVLFLSLFLFTGIGNLAYAAGDDPGAGRLSGENVPEEFYDTDTDTSSLPLLRRYGGFTTENPYTNQVYTHQDPFASCTILNGIDVSQYQGMIDWAKVKAAGIDFAFIRVGYRGYGTAGTLNESTVDPYFDINMQNAIAAGVNVGVYIFSQAITPDEAREEAMYLLNHLGSYNVTMPLIMDYEYAPTSDGGRIKKAKLSKDDATNICLAFCETIAASGHMPMVYANKSMLEEQLNASAISANYSIWLANYTTNTTYGGSFDFWQYSNNGTVDGISGKVDMNFYYARPTDNFSPDSSSISSAIAELIPDQPYTGGQIIPPFTLTLNGITLIPGTDYTVTYSDNINIGTASITITGINTYCDTKTLTFNIVPMAMPAVTAKKRTTSYITLSWSPDSTADGYQIYRSTSLNGTYTKIKDISSSATTSYKNTNLISGQCYYYKIQAYKKVGDKTYYGAFSTVKNLYTKMSYTRTAVAKSGTVIYDTASTAGSVIANPKANVSMAVTYSTKDENGNTWYYVTHSSHQGFVPAGKVTVGKQGKITGSKINVRKSNTTSSKKLTTLNKNKKVTVLKTKKKKGVTWYKVTFKKNSKTYTGWISAPYVKII